MISELQNKEGETIERLQSFYPFDLRGHSDLEIYKESGISEIHNRIGAEIPVYKLRRELAALTKEKLIVTKSSKRWKRYLLNKTA